MQTEYVIVVVWDISLFRTLHLKSGPEPTEYLFSNEEDAMQAYKEIRDIRNKFMRPQSLRLFKRECLIIA